MNNITVLSTKNEVRFEKQKYLWVKWEVELQEGVQHVESKNFIHEDYDYDSKWNSEWRLKLTLNSNPSLSLHFKLHDWQDYFHDEHDEETCADEDVDTDYYFNDHILTTVCDGQIIDIEPDISSRFFKIPVSKQIKSDPGTVLTFKFEVRKIRDQSERNLDFLKSILRSTEFYDMEIRSADGRVLKAHKLIMSLVSPVIKARFVHDKDESNVFNTDFEFEILEYWLDHIYRRNWIDDQTKLETVMNVFMILDFFGTREVSKHCRDVIIHRLSPIILSRVVQHDMIYLAGDQAAKDVQNYIIQVIDKEGLDEIEGMDPDNPRIASFMAKILELSKKRKADEKLSGSKKQKKLV